MPTLGEILNSKIGTGGKSKAYIANALGVGEKTIENYMRGLRSPRPDALIKLSQILKFDLSQLSEQNVPTRTTQTPQISPNSRADHSDTRTEIDKLVARIKAETGLIDEEIAERVGISRQWLSRLCNHEPYSEANYRKIHEAFKDELNHTLTTQTKTPVFEMMPPNGTKDAVIRTQAETVKTMADTTKSQQETISKLTDLVTKLVQK